MSSAPFYHRLKTNRVAFPGNFPLLQQSHQLRKVEGQRKLFLPLDLFTKNKTGTELFTGPLGHQYRHGVENA